jgi:hypothetical protein
MGSGAPRAGSNMPVPLPQSGIYTGLSVDCKALIGVCVLACILPFLVYKIWSNLRTSPFRELRVFPKLARVNATDALIFVVELDDPAYHKKSHPRPYEAARVMREGR